jgi:hypothetical protein
MGNEGYESSHTHNNDSDDAIDELGDTEEQEEERIKERNRRYGGNQHGHFGHRDD